ncbi:MAG: glycosyltransferase family 9 protein [Sphingobacteriales bacterium]|jgi:heptosyltransferase-2|nr:glycosyltransferase family 9 protein [Sphingobacteriales bacterium]MBK7526501.1 glycosyltransferase family 9 protein [Sphingobacteriales bacterium]MBK8679927.1 glycosyltransferase family 9 protein [Sphingobacteriales bacterium]MBL0247482.1 glycosyltransferase family 9 protein [Sphingobacteriales bacterium]MDA0199271.1 glycosyltransferase family 9 protein [Bacteroidota bacterium]
MTISSGNSLQFLIIQTAFIGDAILATSALETLHYYYPNACIDILVRQGNETLFAGHPFLREVVVWQKKQQKIRNLGRLILKIRKKRYHAVINFQRYAGTGLITALSGAKIKAGYNKNPLSGWFTNVYPHKIDLKPPHNNNQPQLHEIDRYAQVLACVLPPVNSNHDNNGAAAPRFLPRLYPSTADYQAVLPYTQAQPYVCIAPASVWFTKQLPTSKWISLLQVMPKNYAVYLLGANADIALCEQIVAAAKREKVQVLAGKFSFLQSAALMQHATMNFVNDSAPMHLASAVNAPVTAVYCSTSPHFGFGPLSNKARVVEVEQPLSCRPCGIRGYNACPKGNFACGFGIEIAQLLSSLP